METYHAVHGVRRQGWPLVAVDWYKWLKLAQNVSHWLTMSLNTATMNLTNSQQIKLLSVAHNDSLAVSDIKPQGQEDNIKMKKEDK